MYAVGLIASRIATTTNTPLENFAHPPLSCLFLFPFLYLRPEANSTGSDYRMQMGITIKGISIVR